MGSGHAKDLRVQRVYIDVFQSRGEIRLRDQADAVVHRTSGLLSRRVLGSLCNASIVDAGHCARLCVGDQRVQGILSLTVQIGGGHHVVIVVAIVRRRAKTGQRCLRLSGIAFGQVGVGQAYGHAAIVRAGQLRFSVVILREIKVVH